MQIYDYHEARLSILWRETMNDNISQFWSLEMRAYYNPFKDVLCVSPDISYGAQQINKVVDILWANDPYPIGKKQVFAGFALQSVQFLLRKNKIHLLNQEVSVAFILKLFIKEYGKDILGKHKKEIYTLLEQDFVVCITTT